MNIAIIFGRKNSKGLKNKNILNILGKPACHYPIEAAKKAKKVDQIFVSSDSKFILNYAKKKKCNIIKRPSFLATDKALLSDAIFHAVKICEKKIRKVNNYIILLCNSVCVNSKVIDNAVSIISKKNIDTVTTISKFNMFSPVRALKIENNYIKNYIPNKIMEKYTSLSGDRDKTVDSYFSTHSCTVSKSTIFKKIKNNSMPFKWMGNKKSYIVQENCVGDIDYEWQLKVAEWWLQKYEK
jgi:CMP-N-acetylneuraminic acid synthetase